MIVPAEIMDMLEVISKDNTVQYTPLAAAHAVALVKLVEKSKITEKRIIELVNRATNTLLDVNEECKRLISLNLDIPQNLLDDAGQLSNLFNDVEQKCKELSQSHIGGFIVKPWKVNGFLKKMNAKFDRLSIAQSISVSTESETLGRIDTTKPESTIVFGSNCDRARITNSACSEYNNYFCDQGSTEFASMFDDVFRTVGTSGFGTKIKFGDNANDVHIENSANYVHSRMPLKYYNENFREAEHDDFFKVPQDIHSFVTERLAAEGLHYPSRNAEGQNYLQIAQQVLHATEVALLVANKNAQSVGTVEESSNSYP